VTRVRVTVLAVLAIGLSGCHAPAASAPVTAPSPSLPPAPPPQSPSRSPSPSPSPTAAPAFAGTVTPATAADVPHTWHPGCPVGPDHLSVLRMSFWGFDNRPHTGTMVVNSLVTHDVVTVFATLYRERFPIRRMRPEDAYGGSDPDSMADDNTSGFNCRYAVASGPAHWSVHAYGEAIDVNTVENPYLFGLQVLPPAGRAYLDRSVYRPGMAVRGGLLVKAFAAVGWTWGGTAFSSPDYQHFSRTGG